MWAKQGRGEVSSTRQVFRFAQNDTIICQKQGRWTMGGTAAHCPSPSLPSVLQVIPTARRNLLTQRTGSQSVD